MGTYTIEAYKQYVEVIKIDPNNVDAVRELSNMGGAPTIIAAAGGGSTSLPKLNGPKGRGTGGGRSSGNSLHHSSSSGYLIPPRVPKILTEGRRKEKVKKNRASNLFNGSCSLKDPLLVLLKGARKNPYVKK